MKFRGVGTALITPFKESGALDEAALARFVEWQIGEGVNFLVPCGTTGESPALTQEEHRRVVQIVVETADERVPVLAGAGGNNTHHAIDLAKIAIDLGADGILSITPYYNKPTPDGLRRHFGMQAEAVEKMKHGFPMILYNVPGRTGVNMTAATTLQIAQENPNIAGVKEASGNMEQILTILRDCADDFIVLSGDDSWTLPLIAAGGDGIISVASNEAPEPMSSMAAAALAGDFTGARRVHDRLLPLMLGNFMESSPGPVKSACKMLGLIPTDTLRPPLAPITAASRTKLQEVLEQCGLFEAARR